MHNPFLASATQIKKKVKQEQSQAKPPHTKYT